MKFEFDINTSGGQSVVEVKSTRADIAGAYNILRKVVEDFCDNNNDAFVVTLPGGDYYSVYTGKNLSWDNENQEWPDDGDRPGEWVASY